MGCSVAAGSRLLSPFFLAQISGKPSIVHLKVDPEALTPMASLSSIREKALAGAR